MRGQCCWGGFTTLSLWMRGQCCWGGFTTLSLWMRYMRGQCCWRGFTTHCHCRWETWEVSAAEAASLHCHCGWEDSAAEVASLHSVIVDERSVSLWMRYMRGQCCWGDFTTQCHCGWDTWEVSAAEVASLHTVIVYEIHERSVLLRWLHYTVSLWMRYMRGLCCWGGFTTQCHCGWKVSAAEVTSLHSVIVDERSVLLRWLHYSVIVDEIHERSVLLRWLHYTVSL